MTNYPMLDDKLATLRHAIEGGVKADSMQALKLMELVDAIGEQFKLEVADASAPAVLTDAARDMLAERERQVTAEGWTPEHDDSHDEGQMAAAAGYYALASSFPHERDLGRGHVPPYWPWEKSWWKPSTKRRNLVKAGALILAEIDRIDRAASDSAEGGAA